MAFNTYSIYFKKKGKLKEIFSDQLLDNFPYGHRNEILWKFISFCKKFKKNYFKKFLNVLHFSKILPFFEVQTFDNFAIFRGAIFKILLKNNIFTKYVQKV